jgi:hypothetical protein
VGELASNVEREKGDELGDNDLRGIESDLLIDRGVVCLSTIVSGSIEGACSRFRSERKMCSVVWATMLIVQITKPARTGPCVLENLSLSAELGLTQLRPRT